MIEGLSNEEYHAVDGLSSTQFDLMRKSMAAFKYRKEFKKESVAFDEGNLIHDAILLPHLVEQNYLESPTKGGDTEAAKRLKRDNPDKIVVGQGMIEQAKELARKVDLIYGDFIRPAHKEVSFFHDDKDTGLMFKCRPDIYDKDRGFILDIKSSKANNHREFLRVLEDYDYDLSAAWYFDTLKLCGYPVEIVGWIVVPKEAPNCPFGFYMTEELLEKGRSKYQKLIAEWMGYLATGVDNLFKPAYSWEYRRENYIGEAA
jgi:hypothetical protein